MILNNVLLMDRVGPQSIEIKDGKISGIQSAIASRNNEQTLIDFTGAYLFPGLINSHDHLDFNLYPQLGNKTYNNYTEWGAYLHSYYKNEIADVLKVPVALREQWGVYKNLLCGVTTVVNHGEKTVIKGAPITVFENTHCLHSVNFEKDWKVKLNNPFNRNVAVSIHAGEGTDELAHTEIDQLIKWNLLKKKLVGIHAVAMTESQAQKFEAIVWCPESNYFLLNKTAAVNVLKEHTKVLFGTDSTLTANWNIWAHIHSAAKTRELKQEELYQSLTINAANVWNLNAGEISAGKDADIIVVKNKGAVRGIDTFFQTSVPDILLVICKGKIRLFDETLYAKMEPAIREDFSRIYTGDVCKYVYGNVPELMNEIRQYYHEAHFPVATD